MSAFQERFDNTIVDYLKTISEAEPALQANIREENSKDPKIASSIGPVEGQLLHFLVKLSQPKRCLEIGTFFGYSALYIASALPQDGTLVTCEIDPDKAHKAQTYFKLSPYANKITLLLGDALETVSHLDGEFDFIFLDANQNQYPKYFDLCVNKLKSGGWMAVDNALWRAEVLTPASSKYGLAVDTFNRKAKADPRLETVLLPLRDGLLLMRKI